MNRCLAIMLSLFAVTAAAAPLFEDVHAVRWEKKAHGYRGNNGDFLALKDGAILWAYTDLNGDIVTITSPDQGKSWSAPTLLQAKPAPPATGRYVHPSFLRLANGEILFSYIHSTHPTTPYVAQNYYRRSNDEGATWTDQFVMTPYPGYTLSHNDRLFIASTGRIISMSEYKAHYPSSRDHNGYVGIAFYSDDNGHSWHASKNTVDMMPVEVQEADGVELKDGRILMFARTYSGHPVRAYSEDGGETWSEGEMIKELDMPYAGLPTVRRIPSTGDLLFLWISEKSVDKDNPKIRRRCTLSSAISKDEGQTFLHQRKITTDPEDDVGYQCIHFFEDNTVLLGHHTRDGLHVKRIGVDWFYGK